MTTHNRFDTKCLAQSKRVLRGSHEKITSAFRQVERANAAIEQSRETLIVSKVVEQAKVFKS